MIATHNIKVNGRWVLAGQEYEAEEQKAPKKAEKPVEEVKEPEAAPEVKAEEAQPKKAPSRRKKASE